MNDNENDVVIPVVSEQVRADAIPVQTGGVRVTKHVEGHDELIEQELRKGRVEIKRRKTNRVVDGPQPVQRSGNTLIIPVVSEILKIEKQWVVTEEIHLTQVEDTETVRQTVRVQSEQANIERLDEQNDVVESVEQPAESDLTRVSPDSLLRRPQATRTGVPRKRGLSGGGSLVSRPKPD